MGEWAGEEVLTAATGDAFRSSRLDRMLDKKTTSYKLYWLRAIFEEAVKGSDEISIHQLAARMVALAWCPVVSFHLNIGAKDRLGRAIHRAREVCSLGDNATKDEVYAAVAESSDRELKERLGDVVRYVPYRLIRPFFDGRLEEERLRLGLDSHRFDHKVKGLVIEYSRLDCAGALYSFADGGRSVELDPDWVTYFCDNQHVVEGWLDMRLVKYLQDRNPSVPAIPLKIRPNQERKLGPAREWWKAAFAKHEFTEIYTHIMFPKNAFSVRGLMSVDHFIPWSFVLHDKVWNLSPMLRSTNSSKGDRLPNLEYLWPFCSQQFDALMSLRESWSSHPEIIDTYLEVDANLADYERTESSLESFILAISHVVKPLWQIAANQGFAVWAG